MNNSKFGEFGGMYIPETLMNAVLELNDVSEILTKPESFLSLFKVL